MGIDIHVRVIYYNRTNKEWREPKLYLGSEEDPTVFDRVRPYTYRNYELFNTLSNISLPIEDNNLPKDLKKEIDDCRNAVGYYGFSEINLADLELYCIKNPTVRDYDSEDSTAIKENPVIEFKLKIFEYLKMVFPFDDFQTLSFVRIIFWFDH